VDEPNVFRNPEFAKEVKSVNDASSPTDLSQQATVSQKRADLSQLADLAAGEQFRLEQELAQACLATGATGAAIALVRGEEIVCHATSGPDAPDIGVRLDPRNGLSGACIQTRRLQQCNDTETDFRVDPEASRTLGVRSIVVLPLIEGDKLFGIFEVLSSQPHAFQQRDLDTLQAVTDRIVRNRSQNWESHAAASPGELAPFLRKAEEVVPSPSSELAAALPLRQARPAKTDWLAATLGMLVIASAVLLGTLVGWRTGWQNATLALRASSPHYRVGADFNSGQVGHTLPAGNEMAPNSAGTDECGQSLAAVQTQPPNGGLTICQAGQVIFRLPASAPLPTRSLPNVRHSSGAQAVPQTR
jgi:putative methionine-R-sulfoxide reductase with GAF domain